jgi:hypothetical protein
MCSPREDYAPESGTWCEWPPTGRHWPGAPGSSTPVGGRSGLSTQALAGGACDAASVWRGAFLAQGSLTEPGRSPALEVACPGPEAAMGLVGAARQLGITAKACEVRGSERVIVRDGAAIGALLSGMGAPETRARWQERRMRRQDLRGTGNRLATFDDANLRRTAEAAGATTARVSRALHILGDSAPDHLAAAGALRLHHPHASLAELGRLADPPLSKDAVTGWWPWPTAQPANSGSPTPHPPSPPAGAANPDTAPQPSPVPVGGRPGKVGNRPAGAVHSPR